jgi:hypothetical protein
LASGLWSFEEGLWVLVFGGRYLGAGLWLLVFGLWGGIGRKFQKAQENSTKD